MNGYWLCLRAALRAGWRAWAGIALIVGLAAGVTIAAAAGARRTDSAHDRFLRAQEAYDVLLPNYPDPGMATFDPAVVERLPQVAESARVAPMFILDTGALATPDGRAGSAINRFEILRGRRPDPARAEEVLLSLTAAEHLGLDVGDTFPLIEPKHAEEAAQAGVRNIRLRVVGVEISPGEVPPLLGTNPGFIHLTQAFYRAYREELEARRDGLLIRLSRGAADIPAFRAALRSMSRGKPFDLETQEEHTTNVRRSFHFQATGFWLLALLVAVTSVFVLAQTLARQAFLDSEGHPALRALGLTRGQLWALGMAPALAASVLGAGLGVAIAVLLSPLTPVGLARTVEPDPGFAADVTALGTGAAATVLAVAAAAAFPAWRVARAGADAGGSRRPSRLASALGGLGLSPAVTTGVRLALSPGRGRTAIPVRSTVGSVVLAIAAVAAALTFGASLTHLLRTPSLYGNTWDLAVTDYGFGQVGGKARGVLGADPAVRAFSLGSWTATVVVDGSRMDALALDAVEGDVLPPVIAGRRPAGPGEIAVGDRSLRKLGRSIGDTVSVRPEVGGTTTRLRIVGTAVLPGISSTARLGEGALMTFSGLRRLSPGDDPSAALIELAPGADRDRVLARLERRLGAVELPAPKPSDLVNFGRVERLPLALTSVVAALALLTIVHLLVTSIRRRRRELAVLKTIGFTRRQLRTALAWQATTVAVLAAFVGVALGVAAGRWAWRLFAGEFGIVPETVIPLAAVLAVIPVAVLLANLVALLPARRAAQTPAAAVLRAE